MGWYLFLHILKFLRYHLLCTSWKWPSSNFDHLPEKSQKSITHLPLHDNARSNSVKFWFAECNLIHWLYTILVIFGLQKLTRFDQNYLKLSFCTFIVLLNEPFHKEIAIAKMYFFVHLFSKRNIMCFIKQDIRAC